MELTACSDSWNIASAPKEREKTFSDTHRAHERRRHTRANAKLCSPSETNVSRNYLLCRHQRGRSGGGDITIHNNNIASASEVAKKKFLSLSLSLSLRTRKKWEKYYRTGRPGRSESAKKILFSPSPSFQHLQSGAGTLFLRMSMFNSPFSLLSPGFSSGTKGFSISRYFSGDPLAPSYSSPTPFFSFHLPAWMQFLLIHHRPNESREGGKGQRTERQHTHALCV